MKNNNTIENIFKGAKFGDKFLTRDGRVAIYLYYNEHLLCKHCLCINGEEPQWFRDDGRFLVREDCDWNIVSRYQEPIDEEKLDAFAKDSCAKHGFYTNLPYDTELWCEAVKVGYRKAKK